MSKENCVRFAQETEKTKELFYEGFSMLMGRNPKFEDFLQSVSKFYKGQGRLEEAEEVYVKLSRVLARSHAGWRNMKVFLRSTNMFYKEIGRYEEAQKIYLNSDGVMVINHIDSSMVHDYLTCVFEFSEKLDKPEIAIQLHLRVYQLLLENGASIRTLQRFFESVTKLYSGQVEAAEQLYWQFYSLLAERSHVRGLTKFLKSMTKFYQEMGRIEAAEDFYLKAYEVFVKHASWETWKSFLKWGTKLYQEMGRLEVAEDLYLKVYLVLVKHRDWKSFLELVTKFYKERPEAVEELLLKGCLLSQDTIHYRECLEYMASWYCDLRKMEAEVCFVKLSFNRVRNLYQ